MCGENSSNLSGVHIVPGSPPRVRGKQGSHVKCGNRQGITPACAGKTDVLAVIGILVRDHPRVCGENCEPLHAEKGGQGSPPRVRGKPARVAPPEQPAGITPACAGKTRRLAMYCLRGWDHPRVCGENFISFCRFSKIKGSPPRVRGKHRRNRDSHSARGITPACAGKTMSASKALTISRDHPRVCGENYAAPTCVMGT